MMKYSILKACFLFVSAFLLHSCSQQKNKLPGTPLPIKPVVAAQTSQPAKESPTTTTASPPATPAATTPIAETPPQAHFDITTQSGYLGKSSDVVRNGKAAVALIPQKDIAKGSGPTSTYRELTFFIRNVSGTPLFITCFSYIKHHRFMRWRWRKTVVQEIKPGESIPCTMKMLDDAGDIKHVFGSLGVFPNRPEAEDATYELLSDDNKLDLDLLASIENKTVIIGIERYGFKETFYDFDISEDRHLSAHLHAQLSFFVQNKTGRPLFTTGFIYCKKAKGRWIAAVEAKDDMSTWRYYKTKVLRLDPGQTGFVDVDGIVPHRDRTFVRGYLGIFDEDREEDAHNKTYELLSGREKINIGLLTQRQGRTIVIEAESYGIANDIIEYTVKPIKWIDFTKIIR